MAFALSASMVLSMFPAVPVYADYGALDDADAEVCLADETYEAVPEDSSAGLADETSETPDGDGTSGLTDAVGEEASDACEDAGPDITDADADSPAEGIDLDTGEANMDSPAEEADTADGAALPADDAADDSPMGDLPEDDSPENSDAVVGTGSPSDDAEEDDAGEEAPDDAPVVAVEAADGTEDAVASTLASASADAGVDDADDASDDGTDGTDGGAGDDNADLAGAAAVEEDPGWLELDGFPGTSAQLGAGTYEVAAALYGETGEPYVPVWAVSDGSAARLVVGADGSASLTLALTDRADSQSVASFGSCGTASVSSTVAGSSSPHSSVTFALSELSGRYVLEGAEVTLLNYYLTDTLYLAADLAGAAEILYSEDEQVDIANHLTFGGELAPESAVESLAPGEYLVVANLFVPGSENVVLGGVTAYISSPEVPPTRCVLTPATMVVDENGVATVHLEIHSVAFLLQDLGSSDGCTYEVTWNDRVYDEENGVVGRIYEADITLGNLSGSYDFSGSKEYAIPLKSYMNMPLHLSLDLANAVDLSLFYQADFEYDDVQLHVETYDMETAELLKGATFTAETLVEGEEYEAICVALDELFFTPASSYSRTHRVLSVALTAADGTAIDLSTCTVAQAKIPQAPKMFAPGILYTFFLLYDWCDGELREQGHFDINEVNTLDEWAALWTIEGNATYVFVNPTYYPYQEDESGWFCEVRGGIARSFSEIDAATGVSATFGFLEGLAYDKALKGVTSYTYLNQTGTALLVSKSVDGSDCDEAVLDAVAATGALEIDEPAIEAAYRVSFAYVDHPDVAWSARVASPLRPSDGFYYSCSLPTGASSAEVYLVTVDADGSKTAARVEDTAVADGSVSFTTYKVYELGKTDTLESLWRGAVGDPNAEGYSYFVVVTDGSSEEADGPATDLVPGTYTVTANLYVPGELNSVLNVDAYLTNPANPLGIGAVSGLPTEPVAQNATLVVDENGAATLELPVANPVFTLQAIGGCANAVASAAGYEDVVYTGDAGPYTTRISQLSVALADTSGIYVFQDCVEFPTLLGTDWTVPLTLVVDFSDVPVNGSDDGSDQPATPNQPGNSDEPTTPDQPAVPDQPMSVPMPQAATGLVYTGQTQVGVAAGEGYTVVGGSAVEAGSHTAVCTLKEGYVWEDGSSDPLTVAWSIAAAPANDELAPGTYAVTANLYVPAELNAVLNVDAYLTNPANPLGVGGVEGLPIEPVSDNATLVVREDGTRVLVIPVVNPVFTLQSASSGDNVTVLGSVRDDETYGTDDGAQKQGRIVELYVELLDDSGSYQLGECTEFPTLLGVDWAVPLRIGVDFSSMRLVGDGTTVDIPAASDPSNSGVAEPGTTESGTSESGTTGSDATNSDTSGPGATEPTDPSGGQGSGDEETGGAQPGSSDEYRLTPGTYTVTANIWLSDRSVTGLPLMPYLTSGEFPPMNPVRSNATLVVDDEGRATLTIPIAIQEKVMTVSALSGLNIVGTTVDGAGNLTSVTIDLGVVTDMGGIITQSCSATVVMGSLASTISGITGTHTWPATFQVNFTGVPVSSNAGSSYDWEATALQAGKGTLATEASGAARDLGFLAYAVDAVSDALLAAGETAAWQVASQTTATAGVVAALSELDGDDASAVDAAAALALAGVLAGDGLVDGAPSFEAAFLQDGLVADAQDEPADSSASEAEAEDDDALSPDAFRDGVLSFGGVQVALPEDVEVANAGILAVGANEAGTLTVCAYDLSMVELPDDAEVRAAFLAAATEAGAAFETAGASDLGTRGLSDGASTVYRYAIDAAGFVDEDGTVDDAQVWQFTQQYVALADGGFALVQLGLAQDADDEARAAYETACASLELADDDAAADGDAGSAVRTPCGFAFDLPEGLAAAEGTGGVWLGEQDNLLVVCLGELVAAPDAASFDAEAADDTLRAMAEATGGTYVGSQELAAADGTVTVGVFSVPAVAGSHEALVALVPVADGSVEGLMVVCDTAAADTWADDLAALVCGISVAGTTDELEEALAA